MEHDIFIFCTVSMRRLLATFSEWMRLETLFSAEITYGSILPFFKVLPCYVLFLFHFRSFHLPFAFFLALMFVVFIIEVSVNFCH
jgi:hypothetical protein